MAINYWNPASSGDLNWGTAANWTLGSIPGDNDIATFSGGGYSCTVNQNAICSGVYVSGIYVGNITASGYGFYLTDSLNDDGSTGIRNYGSGVVLHGVSGTFHIGSSVGTISSTSTHIFMNTLSGYIDHNKAWSPASLTIGSECIITNIGSAQTSYNTSGVALTFINGGTLTHTTRANFARTTNGDLWQVLAGTPILNNNASNTRFDVGASGVTLTLPSLTVIGNANILFATNLSRVPGTFTFTGPFTHSTAVTSFAVNTAVGTQTCTYNFGSYTHHFGQMTTNVAVSTASITVNFETSTVNLTSYNGTTTGATTINLNSSTINCSGDWLNDVDQIFNPENSTLNIINTSSITTKEKVFNNINFSGAPTNTYTISGNLNCGNLILYSGNYIQVNSGLYTSGNLEFKGTGTVTLGSGVYFNAPVSTGLFASTLSTFTATSTALEFYSPTSVLTTNKAIVFKKLLVGSGVTFSNNGGQVSSYTDITPLEINNATSVTFSRGINCYASGNGNILSISGNPDINITSQNLQFGVYNGVTTYVPSLTCRGTTGSVNFFVNTTAAASGIAVLSGNLMIPNLGIISTAAGRTLMFSGNGYNVNCGNLVTGGSAASAICNVHYGSGTWNIGSLLANNNLGTCIDNLDSATINCSGATWNWGSNHEVIPGTSLVNIKNTSTITSNNKSFYDLNINMPTSGLVATFVGAPNILGDFTVTEGSTNLSNLTSNFYGDVLFDGTGNHVIGSGIILNNDGEFSINSTTGNITSAGCVLNAMKNANIRVGSKDITLSRLALTSGYAYNFESV